MTQDIRFIVYIKYKPSSPPLLFSHRLLLSDNPFPSCPFLISSLPSLSFSPDPSAPTSHLHSANPRFGIFILPSMHLSTLTSSPLFLFVTPSLRLSLPSLAFRVVCPIRLGLCHKEKGAIVSWIRAGAGMKFYDLIVETRHIKLVYVCVHATGGIRFIPCNDREPARSAWPCPVACWEIMHASLAWCSGDLHFYYIHISWWRAVDWTAYLIAAWKQIGRHKLEVKQQSGIQSNDKKVKDEVAIIVWFNASHCAVTQQSVAWFIHLF